MTEAIAFQVGRDDKVVSAESPLPVSLKDADGNDLNYAAVVLSGSAGWSVPQSGFSNPQYFATSVNDSTGFDVSAYEAIVFAWEGTYSGLTTTVQGTLDPTGATGWFSVPVIDVNAGPTSSASTARNTTGNAYWASCAGIQRMRVLVTAIASGTATVRVGGGDIRAMVGAQVAVGGLSAHDLAVSGAPIRVGARARASGAPYSAVSADDVADVVTDLLGNLKTTQSEFNFSNISTSTTTTVKSGSGSLRGVTVNTKGAVASTVTIYDNTAGSGTKIGIIDSLNLSGQFLFDVAFATGLTVVTTGAPDITVVYR